MLTANQNLSGIWAVWDVPAEGVIAAARAASKEHLVITTVDLGLNVAVEMAENGLVKGVGAQRLSIKALLRRYLPDTAFSVNLPLPMLRCLPFR